MKNKYLPVSRRTVFWKNPRLFVGAAIFFGVATLYSNLIFDSIFTTRKEVEILGGDISISTRKQRQLDELNRIKEKEE